MPQPPIDTRPAAEEKQLEIIRQMPPWRKIELVFEMNDTVSELAKVGIRYRYPGINENELRRRYADLVLGKDLAQKVYGSYKQD